MSSESNTTTNQAETSVSSETETETSGDTTTTQIVRLEHGDTAENVCYGQPYTGFVNGIQDYGVFVTLARNVRREKELKGLVHSDNLPPLFTPTDYVPGDKVTVEALEKTERGLSLGLYRDEYVPEAHPSQTPLSVDDRPVLGRFTRYNDPGDPEQAAEREDMNVTVDALETDSITADTTSTASSTSPPTRTDSTARAEAETSDSERGAIPTASTAVTRGFSIGDEIHNWVYCGPSELDTETQTTDGVNGRVSIAAATERYTISRGDPVALLIRLSGADADETRLLNRPAHKNGETITIPTAVRTEMNYRAGDVLEVFARSAPSDAELEGMVINRPLQSHDETSETTTDIDEVSSSAETSSDSSSSSSSSESNSDRYTIQTVSDGQAMLVPTIENSADLDTASTTTSEIDSETDSESDTITPPSDATAASERSARPELAERGATIADLSNEGYKALQTVYGRGDDTYHYARTTDQATLCGRLISSLGMQTADGESDVRTGSVEDAPDAFIDRCPVCDRYHELAGLRSDSVTDAIRAIAGIDQTGNAHLTKPERIHLLIVLRDALDATIDIESEPSGGTESEAETETETETESESKTETGGSS